MHANKACKDFEMKNLVDYYDLYVQNDTLTYLRTLEICLEKYELDHAKSLLTPGVGICHSEE